MAVTTICEVRNMSSFPATVVNRENLKDTAGPRGQFAPGQSQDGFAMNVPWCADGKEFEKRHIDVTLSNVVVGTTSVGARTFTVWQAAHATDRVRVSRDGQWHDPGDEIGGMSAVGVVEEFVLQADQRILVITDGALWLLPKWMIDLVRTAASAVSAASAQLVEEAARPPIPSVPRSNAVAHSMAGVASDAFDQGKADARFLYRDAGKRYAFDIVEGAVKLQPPVMVPALAGGKQVPALTEAISFNRLRRGESIPLPQLDLIAANGGRVFAKERGTDRFFFAVVDEMFIHGLPGQAEFAVPSVYFKADPEFNRAGANRADVLQPLAGDFAAHPAAIRFAAFRTLLDFGFPALVVRARRGAWHLIDARPPAFRPQDQALLAVVQKLTGNGPFMTAFPSVVPSLRRLLPALENPGPPPQTPSYKHVRYSLKTAPQEEWQSSIAFRKVLDIGVGHVHYHQQYERVTGGELQMLLAPFQNNPFFADHLSLYQFLNGPVVDLDGFNDGTCNFYLLAELNNGTPALLYLDEQSLFSSRWRLADPEGDAANMSLVQDLAASPGSYPKWSKDKFWSPFRAGLVGPRSRLAVSAQVVLVSGDKDKEPDTIYSINFSWGTMDTTWRWRKLPAGATPTFFATDAEAGKEVIPGGGNTVFPQTIRLRDDMTMHVKGTRGGVVGRWYQRYLPASNDLVPPLTELVAGQRPGRPYTHAWKFMSEPLFQLADQFSQLGVYDQVDSRTQYYPVQPASDADAKALETVAANPNDWWTDAAALSIQTYSFRLDTLPVPWPPFPPFKKDLAMQPASLFNPAMMLRIVKRGAGWIAVRRDKRDDDFAAFSGLPRSVNLTNKARDRSARVTLQPGVTMPPPPVIQKAFFWITGGQANLAMGASSGMPDVHAVFRVRMAALGNRPGEVISLLDVTTPGQLKAIGGYWQYQWTPTADELARLKTYGSADGEKQSGASIWFEDWTGHTAVAEEPVHWAPPPMIIPKTVPPEITEGAAVSISVLAQDALTSQALQGQVKIDGAVVAATGVPFTYTFSTTPRRVLDPDTQTWLTRPGLPPVSVVVSGYPETPVPLQISRLHVWVEPASIAIGPALQVTVRAEDTATRAPVGGRVKLNGQDVAATNTSFAYTFAAALPSAVVTAPGYTDTPVTWPTPHPALLLIGIQPPPATNASGTFVVKALDSVLRTAIDGTVTIDGKQVARTGASFAYRFATKPVRRFDPATKTWSVEPVMPVITVSAAGYPDAQLELELDPTGGR